MARKRYSKYKITILFGKIYQRLCQERNHIETRIIQDKSEDLIYDNGYLAGINAAIDVIIDIYKHFIEEDKI